MNKTDYELAELYCRSAYEKLWNCDLKSDKEIKIIDKNDIITAHLLNINLWDQLIENSSMNFKTSGFQMAVNLLCSRHKLHAIKQLEEMGLTIEKIGEMLEKIKSL